MSPSLANNVFNCPKVAEGEAWQLMDRAREVCTTANAENETVLQEDKVI
jgi:hypothetical protein